MPLEKTDDFGTDAEGRRISDYCHFCFQKGAFTEPDITMQQMIDKCAGIMAGKGIMPEAGAKQMLGTFLPMLKRWQGK